MRTKAFKWELLISAFTALCLLFGILAYQIRVNTQVENLLEEVSDIKTEVQGLGTMRIAIASLKERVANLETAVFNLQVKRDEE